jgi:hypothetical protein
MKRICGSANRNRCFLTVPGSEPDAFFGGRLLLRNPRPIGRLTFAHEKLYSSHLLGGTPLTFELCNGQMV